MRRLKCLVSTFFYLFLKVLFDEWSFESGFCPFYGTWWGILSKLYFVNLGTSWRILSKLYFVYLLSTFLINFAHLDLNKSFLKNWHSTDTFFLAMCWGGGVRTGTFFGHTQIDYKLNISDKFKKNPTSGLGGDATTRLLQCWVMSNSRLCFWQNKIIFGRTHLYIEKNLYARFRQNSSSGFGEDAIKVKIKDGWRLAAESYPGRYGIAGFKACKTNFT